MEALKKDIDNRPDDYNYQRAARFEVSTHAIWAAMRRLKISHKKTLKHPQADPAQPAIHRAQIKHYKKEGRPIIYLDESGFAVSSPRTDIAKKEKDAMVTTTGRKKGGLMPSERD